MGIKDLKGAKSYKMVIENMYITDIKIEKIMECIADPQKIRFIATIDRDVSDILPYLNAVIKESIYNKNVPSLTITKGGRLITIHPTEIAAGKIVGEEDARKVLDWLKEVMNDCDARRDEITPDYEMRRKLAPLDVYKLLPETNCGKCGEPSCMAFAVKLAGGDVPLSRCAEIYTDAFAEKRTALTKVLTSVGYKVSEEGPS